MLSFSLIFLKWCGILIIFSFMVGKSYDLVSFAAHKPDATVILASASESKVGEC